MNIKDGLSCVPIGLSDLNGDALAVADDVPKVRDFFII